MDWFANNWPMLLIVLGVFIVLSGLMRKLAKLAFIGIAVGVLGLILWPMVSSSL
jgi:membrane-bound ClpP family serine protease